MGEAAQSIRRERKRVTVIPAMWLADDQFSVVFRMPDGAEICFDMDYRTAINGITSAQKTFLLGRIVPWIAGDRPSERDLHAADSCAGAGRGRNER